MVVLVFEVAPQVEAVLGHLSLVYLMSPHFGSLQCERVPSSLAHPHHPRIEQRQPLPGDLVEVAPVPQVVGSRVTQPGLQLRPHLLQVQVELGSGLVQPVLRLQTESPVIGFQCSTLQTLRIN